MSVYKSKRGKSSVQFVETARKLEEHTLEQCLKVPKRYTFLLTQRIMGLASTVYEEVVAANSIYPTNQHEAQLRRDHLTAANAALQALDRLRRGGRREQHLPHKSARGPAEAGSPDGRERGAAGPRPSAGPPGRRPLEKSRELQGI